MKPFHTQNGTINLEGVESITYSKPPTMSGQEIAAIRMMTGALYTVAGQSMIARLKQETNWLDHQDGPHEEIDTNPMATEEIVDAAKTDAG